MPRIPASLCVKCKGYKRLCGLPRCPLLERYYAQVRAARLAGKGEVEGYTPPSAIVGEEGYPKVNVFYMVPPGTPRSHAYYYEAPREWALRGESLEAILRLRSSLVAGVVKVEAGDPWKLYEKELSLAAVSEKPVESEVVLEKPPQPRLRFDAVVKPVGPSSPAREVRIGENPRPPRPLEKLLWDDALAAEALWEAYRGGVDIYSLQRALSLGLLGRLRSRKLVPTRWAITAVDDTVSRLLRRRIKDYKPLDSVEVYEWEHLGNRYVIVLYPGGGWFEWIEVWHPFTPWTRGAGRPVVWRVTETPRGRVSAIDGGFSAARIAVLEYMEAVRRRADVLILREVYPSYYAPVGNWQIREGVRLALSSKPIKFQDLGEAIAYALSKLKADQGILASKSPLLRGLKQRRLTDYFSH